MATSGQRKNPHRRLDEAARYIKRLEKRLAEAEEQIQGFGDLVRELSRSMQKTAQGNYRSLDERMGQVEGAVKDLDAKKSDRRKPAKKEEDEKKAR